MSTSGLCRCDKVGGPIEKQQKAAHDLRPKFGRSKNQQLRS
jgi:hypothetical protein